MSQVAEMAVRIPDRSLTQRLESLEKANRIRSGRAKVKREIKRGRAGFDDAVYHPDCASMRVFELLLSMPRIGRVKANKMLAQAGVSPSRSLSGLTERQRDALRSLMPR